MIMVKLLIIKCIRTLRGYSTIQNVSAKRIEILEFIDVRNSDLNIVLILLWLVLFTNSMQ